MQLNFEIQSTFKMNLPHIHRFAINKSLLPSVRAWLLKKLVNLTSPLYAKFTRASTQAWDYTPKELLKMPAGTLGRRLGAFLTMHSLSLIPKFEEHDVFHVLLAYETNVVDEIKMQCCLLGSRKRSLYVLGTVGLGLVLYPEYIKVFYKAYKRGRFLLPFWKWDFRYLLKENLTDLQALIEKKDRIQEQIFF